MSTKSAEPTYKTTLIKLSEIKPNPDNPRIIRDEKFNQLVKSIKDFPKMLYLRPVVVNDELMVLGGNMRLRAAEKAGLKEIPVIKASELSAEEQKEFIIKDNVGFGEWNWDTLANEWNTEQLIDWGMEIPNFKSEVEGNFNDQGITSKNQFGVIVICEDETIQEQTFKDLAELGYTCKVVVT
jgi:hypothetical protein